MSNRDVVVSVYCLAYNHGKYIKDALEGFVNQKTEFKYEVIVHDDASTDDTAIIIKKYAEKYPDIIKPILQKENQYSRGVDIVDEIISPLLTGKYTASCEGDDYWCDSNKLQKQVEFLENNWEYSACVHNTQMYDMRKKKFITMYEKKEKDLDLEDVIYRGGQSYQTSSLLCKTDFFRIKGDYMKCITGVGDYPLSISLMAKGKIHYFSEVMSIYRYGVPGSWSASQTRKRSINIYYQSIQMLQIAKKEFSNLYDELFESAINRYEYEIKKAESDYSILKQEKYKEFYERESKTNKIKIQIKRLLCYIHKCF